jgi:hypothetical protein
MKKIVKLFLLPVSSIFLLAACMNEPVRYPEAEEYSSAEYQKAPETFISTMRLHDAMPALTFVRTVGDAVFAYDETQYYGFPNPLEVSIDIKDYEGHVIQFISGLTQNNLFQHNDIMFADYNFDGYLDMSLLRWQDSAGGILENRYFLLWDAGVSQFVLNEQLMDIYHAGIYANQDTKQIVKSAL